MFLRPLRKCKSDLTLFVFHAWHHFTAPRSAESSLFLQLAKMYPGLLMNLLLYAREVPLVSFEPGLVKLDLRGAVKAFAIQPTGTQIPLFTLNTVSVFLSIIYLIFSYKFQSFLAVGTRHDLTVDDEHRTDVIEGYFHRLKETVSN